MEYRIKIKLPGYVFMGIFALILGIWCFIDLIYLEFDAYYLMMMIVSLGFGWMCIAQGTEIKKVNNMSDDDD